MNILGIDQSTRSSGWCLLAEGVIQKYGVIKTPENLTGLEAALHQCEQIELVINAKNADVLALEDLYLPKFFGRVRKTSNGYEEPKDTLNAKTLILLGSLRGMLVLTARKLDIQHLLITSPEVCEYLGIPVNTARTPKKRTSRQIAAMELFGDRTRWQEIPEDTADAIAISQIAQRKLLISERIIV